jgi:hypothetical protein
MKNNKLFKVTTILMISAVALISSCSDEERINAEDTRDITEEAVTDAYFQDMDDMAGITMESASETSSGRSVAGGRFITTIQDDRFKCNGIVVSIVPAADSNFDVPKGVITVDFGTTGCTDLRGNIRTGKIIFTYSGKRFTPGATVVTTVDNYTINGIKLEGTRTLTNVQLSTSAAPRFTAVLTDGVAHFGDGTSAERESTITFEWIRAANPLDDKLLIDESSTASGVTRAGRSYNVSLLEALEYKRFCGIAVTGVKKFVVDGGKEIIIDYGDGECDKSVTVTVNGVTRDIRVG